MTLPTLPISEIFLSVQGEGFYVGTPMFFIRLAGCPVGRKQYERIWNCKTCTGVTFECDTDFSVYYRHTPDEIIRQNPDRLAHVCITGGEPFIHDLLPLIIRCREMIPDVMIHVETSGTVWDDHVLRTIQRIDWLTVSPKEGVNPHMISHAHELKFLIGEAFQESDIEPLLARAKSTARVYYQPIAPGGTDTDVEAVQRVLYHLTHPTPFVKKWDIRLSAQSHKFWKAR